MKSYLKRKTAEQQIEAPEHDPERELGFAVVVCPHYLGCKYSAIKSKKARHRCYGKLYKICHWESLVVIDFKCKLAGKRMLIEIKGDKIRHIPADSADYQTILPRLQTLSCNNCGARVLDYFPIYGETVVEAKCHHDGHPDVYPLG